MCWNLAGFSFSLDDPWTLSCREASSYLFLSFLSLLIFGGGGGGVHSHIPRFSRRPGEEDQRPFWPQVDTKREYFPSLLCIYSRTSQINMDETQGDDKSYDFFQEKKKGEGKRRRGNLLLFSLVQFVNRPTQGWVLKKKQGEEKEVERWTTISSLFLGIDAIRHEEWRGRLFSAAGNRCKSLAAHTHTPAWRKERGGGGIEWYLVLYCFLETCWSFYGNLSTSFIARARGPMEGRIDWGKIKRGANKTQYIHIHKEKTRFPAGGTTKKSPFDWEENPARGIFTQELPNALLSTGLSAGC